MGERIPTKGTDKELENWAKLRAYIERTHDKLFKDDTTNTNTTNNTTDTLEHQEVNEGI